MSAWELAEVQDITAEQIYELYLRHHLVPESVPVAISAFRAIALGSWVADVRDGENVVVATVIVSSIITGDRADLDLIPVSKYFRGNEWPDRLREATVPLWDMVFGVGGCRRMTACVPASRPRTIRALEALGFVNEGTLREAVHIHGQEPEGLVVLGLLPADLEVDHHGAT